MTGQERCGLCGEEKRSGRLDKLSAVLLLRGLSGSSVRQELLSSLSEQPLGLSY